MRDSGGHGRRYHPAGDRRTAQHPRRHHRRRPWTGRLPVHPDRFQESGALVPIPTHIHEGHRHPGATPWFWAVPRPPHRSAGQQNRSPRPSRAVPPAGDRPGVPWEARPVADCCPGCRRGSGHRPHGRSGRPAGKRGNTRKRTNSPGRGSTRRTFCVFRAFGRLPQYRGALSGATQCQGHTSRQRFRAGVSPAWALSHFLVHALIGVAAGLGILDRGIAQAVLGVVVGQMMPASTDRLRSAQLPFPRFAPLRCGLLQAVVGPSGHIAACQDHKGDLEPRHCSPHQASRVPRGQTTLPAREGECRGAGRLKTEPERGGRL